MQSYLDLLKDVLENGVEKTDRTGTGTISVFGRQWRHDLSKGFPLLTTKKLHWHSIAHELIWFLNGETNVKYLQDNKVSIWDEWADESGELGPVYGKQWRSWPTLPEFRLLYALDDWPNKQLTENQEGVDECDFIWKPIDQIKNAIDTIINNPDSRRIIVSAWNVADVPNMQLPPCHLLFQFYVVDGKLSCMMTQRSCDAGLGLPFNIASYALLTHMIAYVTNLSVGELIISFGDLHIYKNHLTQIKEQLTREPTKLPSIQINFDKEKYKYLKDLQEVYNDIVLIDYKALPNIPMKVSV